MTGRRAGRTRRRAIAAAVLAAALAVTAPATSWAYWSTTAPAVTGNVSAGVVTVPGDFQCTSRPGTLGLTPYVDLTWDAVPGAVSYEVWLRNADGSIRSQMNRATPAAPTQEVRATLADLLQGLIDLLLGGQPIYAEVVAVHAGGWTSQPTADATIVRTGLLPGLLGGLRCQ